MADEQGPFRNRIVGQGVKPADQFLANPSNFRKHPQIQRDAMRGALEEVGWVDDVIVNLRTSEQWPDGERGVETLVDGHERVWQALQHNNAPVPYKEVDLTPKEEAKVLATFDAITGLAEIDAAAFADVLRDVDTGSAAIQEMLAAMAEEAGIDGMGDDWQRESFDGLIPQTADSVTGQSEKNGQWFYVEFYEDEGTWEELRSLLSPYQKGQSMHELDRRFFEAMVRGYLATL